MILLPAVRTEILVVRVVAPEALQALALDLELSLAVGATDVEEDVWRRGHGHVDGEYRPRTALSVPNCTGGRPMAMKAGRRVLVCRVPGGLL